MELKAETPLAPKFKPVVVWGIDLRCRADRIIAFPSEFSGRYPVHRRQLHAEPATVALAAELDVLEHQPACFIVTAIAYRLRHADCAAVRDFVQPRGFGREHAVIFGRVGFDKEGATIAGDPVSSIDAAAVDGLAVFNDENLTSRIRNGTRDVRPQ